MEEHVILKLEGDIKEKLENDLKEGKTDFTVEKTGDGSFVLAYKEKLIPLKLVDLPCIIESHKTVNNQQFKVCDISQMLCMDYEEGSGLTPPMRFVKYRRFRKRMCKYDVKEVEDKVAQLLEKERNADEVEIIWGNDVENDISSFVEELEMNLPLATENKELIMKQNELKEIEQKIKAKQEQMSVVINPIMKKRFEEVIESLKKDYEECKKQIQDLLN